MAEWRPEPETQYLLDRAWYHTQLVPYRPSVRFVFYRLLQEGTLPDKKGYKRLLTCSSRARKGFYQGWRPDTFADDTRTPLLMEREGHYTLHVRAGGFETAKQWMEALAAEINCPLDRWADQAVYVEVWFEAAAMMEQFRYYCNENVPLLAFRGDISIDPKWQATRRLYDRWRIYGQKVKILYFGDLDDKGLEIPRSAVKDIYPFSVHLMHEQNGRSSTRTELIREYEGFRDDFEFIRVGLNPDHPAAYDIPENPERPGTYQWEGLNDAAAEGLIATVEDHLDLPAFDRVAEEEELAAERIRKHLRDLMDEGQPDG